MNAAQITVELSKMNGPDLYAAALGLGINPMAMNKAQCIAVLRDEIVAHRTTLGNVQSYRGLGNPVGRSQAAPSAPTVDTAVAAAAGRAEAVALEAKTQSDTLTAQVQTLKASVAGLSETLTKTQGELAAVVSTKGQKAAVERAIAKQVAEAFGPIKAAAEANQAQAAVVAASAAPVGQDTAWAVFGVDVRDTRGNPIMVDLWGHPDAPAIDETFIWTEANLAPLITAQAIRANVWMGGEKGTGKTETARQFAARTGRAFTRINFHKFTTVEEFIGAQGLTSGSTGFVPGPFLRSFCSTPGSITLCDEITNCDPGELAYLNGLLEPNGRVNIGGAVWTAAPGALCFVADNTGGNGDTSGRYVGTRVMNPALLDRFALKVPFTFLPLEREIEAVVKHTGCNPALATLAMRVVTTARAKVQTGEVIDAPSIRQVMAWVRAMPTLGVRRAWDLTVAASQPAESTLAIEAIFTAEVNEAELQAAL
jgi:MoxR-like ATPase